MLFNVFLALASLIQYIPEHAGTVRLLQRHLARFVKFNQVQEGLAAEYDSVGVASFCNAVHEKGNDAVNSQHFMELHLG